MGTIRMPCARGGTTPALFSASVSSMLAGTALSLKWPHTAVRPNRPVWILMSSTSGTEGGSPTTATVPETPLPRVMRTRETDMFQVNCRPNEVQHHA
jgi:hypothetical protein